MYSRSLNLHLFPFFIQSLLKPIRFSVSYYWLNIFPIGNIHLTRRHICIYMSSSFGPFTFIIMRILTLNIMLASNGVFSLNVYTMGGMKKLGCQKNNPTYFISVKFSSFIAMWISSNFRNRSLSSVIYIKILPFSLFQEHNFIPLVQKYNCNGK